MQASEYGSHPKDILLLRDTDDTDQLEEVQKHALYHSLPGPLRAVRDIINIGVASTSSVGWFQNSACRESLCGVCLEKGVSSLAYVIASVSPATVLAVRRAERC